MANEKNNIEEKEVKVDESASWFSDYDKPQELKDMLPIFEMKLSAGQLSRKEKIVFLDEGKKGKTRFGETITFTIRNQNADKIWFIKRTQYSLLNPIAKARKEKSLVGREATVERIGTKAETRWAIEIK